MECTVEFFDSRRLKINIDTLDVTLHLPNKKFGDGSFRLSVLQDCQWPSHQGYEHVHLHLGLELILQNTIEFLHVVLQERVQ